MKRPTAAQAKNAKIHHAFAILLGYNELASRAQTLGEKLYFRSCRNKAEKQFRKIGGQIKITGDVIICTPPFPISAHLYEKDIEMIRTALAYYDAVMPRTRVKEK